MNAMTHPPHRPADPGAIIDVAIVGAGISGIGMAVHLRRECPDKSLVVLERRADLGGTWDLFRYPGVRSDSDMHTLGFVFEPWTDEKAIADGPAILRYLHRIVDGYDLRPHMRFNTHVRAAAWSSEEQCWTLTCSGDDGRETTVRARFLFLGSGYYDYDDPHAAALPPHDAFAGDVLHPQFWPADYDYSGKRIVIVGSGATAVTMLPAMTDRAAHVTMLQRTPTWYFSRPSRDALANALRSVMPDRWAYAITRWRNIHLQRIGFNRARRKPEKVKAFLLKRIRKAMGGTIDEATFTPPYDPWDQRLCLVPDEDMFRALRAERASIVTERIAAFEPDGLRLATGAHLPADVVVTATGLRLAVAGKIAFTVDGASVDWHQRYYYKGCMFSGIPNLAAVFGYLNASWTLKADVVSAYVCRLLHHMDAQGARVATPVPPPRMEADPTLFDFSSGYIQRAIDTLPQQGRAAPWRLNQDYLLDRRILLRDPIDDGALVFDGAHATTTA